MHFWLVRVKRVDILARTDRDVFDLVEVKSNTAVIKAYLGEEA